MTTIVTPYTTNGSQRGLGADISTTARGREHAALVQTRNVARQEAQQSRPDVVVSLGQQPTPPPATYAAPVNTGFATLSGQPSSQGELLLPLQVSEPATLPPPPPDGEFTARSLDGGSASTPVPPDTAPLSLQETARYSSLSFDPAGTALPTPISFDTATVSGQGEFNLSKDLIDHSRFSIELGEGASINYTRQDAGPLANDSVQVDDNGQLAINATTINNATSSIVLGADAKLTYNYIFGPDNGQDQIQVSDNGRLTINSKLINNSRNQLIIGDGAEVTFNFRINPDNADDSIIVKDNGNLAFDLNVVNNRNTLFEVGANTKVTINSEVNLDMAEDRVLTDGNGRLSIRSGYIDKSNALFKFGADQDITLNSRSVYDSIATSLTITGQEHVSMNPHVQDKTFSSLVFQSRLSTAPGQTKPAPLSIPSLAVPAPTPEDGSNAGSSSESSLLPRVTQGVPTAPPSFTPPPQGPTPLGALDFSALRIVQKQKDLSYLTAADNGNSNGLARAYGKQKDDWQVTVRGSNGRFTADI